MAVVVIDPESPHQKGPEREMDATMTRHVKAPNDTERPRAPHRGRWLHGAIALACAIVSLTSMTMALDAGDAYARNWMEVSCENPNQSGAPSEGWTSFAAGGGYGSNNSTSCGPGNPMFAILSTDAAVGVGSAETLQYIPPGGSTLTGGSVDVSLYADGGGYNASGTAVAYTPKYAYDGSDVFYQCASGLPPCANGTYDFAGVLQIPGGRGGNLYLSAGCGGHEGYACNSGGSEGAWSLVRLWWADLLLSNTATPDASGVSGTLLSPNAHATEELTFDATDPGGPGVYAVTVQIDGKAIYSGTPDNNGGKCAAVGTSNGALMFDYSQPCKQSESVDLPINTSALADGQHTLKVIVEDAAQNSSVVYDGTITTQNAPAKVSSLGALPGPGTSGTGTGTLLASGAPNGSSASEGAQLRLGERRAITRVYAHRALRLTGRLLNSQGHPIGAATLDVLQQITGSASLKVVGHVKTRSNGTFKVPVPGGPSRLLEIGYRAFSADNSYAAQAKVQESVGAGIQLHVSPRRTGAEGTITLSGRVLGPVPAEGIVVELLVHYRGRWEPFRDPRTDSRGRFQVVYQFQGGVGRFPFRALAFGGQAGFPFAHGESEAVYVTTI
ncbi:MAG: hypothetical protein WAN93_07120 [Solirubrobacteraceae bacterium]